MEAVQALAMGSPSRDLTREILIRGPISRADLSKRLGLSVASLTRLSRPLIDAGIIVETDDLIEGLIGRPTRPLDVRPDAHCFIGIKLTGDGANAVLTDLRARTLESVYKPFTTTAPQDVADTIGGLISDLSRTRDVSAIGISLGGKVGADGIVLRAPFLNWRNVPLVSLLQKHTAVPIVLENDAVALTVGEQWFGAGRGESNFAVLTVGAGVGYGLVINDRVIAPPDAGLGLAGHYPLDPAGPLCMNGHRGCSTAMITMPGICAQISATTGTPVSYAEALDMARNNHPVASSVINSAVKALGTLIAAVANLAMVELVILSGEGVELVDAAPSVLDEAVQNQRDPEALPVRRPVQPTGFDQWARGAAAVAIQHAVIGSKT